MINLTETENKALAELLFPHITETPEQCGQKFPKRDLKEGARVTRYAPSPTGFMHIGNLFSAFISERVAHTTGGVFYVRIEDTDKKREVEGGVSGILRDLAAFGCTVDEGVVSENEEKGAYGPYRQSNRKEIYHIFAKSLVEKGFAYPCFCSAETLDEVRKTQEAEKKTTGYYGEYAHCRRLSLDEIKANISEGRPYVLRLRSPGKEDGKVYFDDVIKGKIEMPENTQDIVLLKTDGIPTYHFAHAVDDHLMGTTHVVRGDEWIASAPIHLQLFRLLGFKAPKYAHIAPLMKEENGGKRKLSKRKDPEAAVSFYFEQGYPSDSVREYLLTLANSNYEEWHKVNKTASQDDFPFNLKKMSSSGALFDLVKFDDVSKNVISAFSADKIYQSIADWAQKHSPDFYKTFTANPKFSKHIFTIDRSGKNPRKDIAKWSEVPEYTSYFFAKPETFDMPENLSAEDIKAVICEYANVYNENDDKDAWFGGMKSICSKLGFCENVKEYKQSPEAFKGHVGDVSTVIRVAVTGRRNTPDLYEIMKLLGREEVVSRLKAAAEKLS